MRESGGLSGELSSEGEEWRGGGDSLLLTNWEAYIPNGRELSRKLISSSLDLRAREFVSNFGKALRGRDDNSSGVGLCPDEVRVGRGAPAWKKPDERKRVEPWSLWEQTKAWDVCYKTGNLPRYRPCPACNTRGECVLNLNVY